MTAHRFDLARIRSDHPLLETISRYVDVKKKGSEYVGLCPFHAEKDPSLTIYRGGDGNQRYRCFPCGAGSEGGDVIDFIRAYENCTLTEAVAILEEGRMPSPGAAVPRELPPDESDCWEPIVPAPDDAPPYDPAKTFNPKHGRTVRYKPERLDTYRDAAGRILCHVVRLVFDDGEKLCPVITWCDGPGGARWACKRMKPPYPLLGLPELAARPTDTVLLVSGEKCVAAAREHAPAFVPVTWLGGDAVEGATDWTPLRGREVVYWPDADDSCRLAVAKIAERLAAP